jgi:hypothetical protein
MGGAGIYSAATMAGPWSYEGSLYNQMIPEPEVGLCMHSCACTAQVGAVVVLVKQVPW